MTGALRVKMPCPLLTFSQSDNLIQVVDMNSNTEWQTVQFQIIWLLKKPTDLDLHCLQRHGISGFSRTRVKFKWTKTEIISHTKIGSMALLLPLKIRSRSPNYNKPFWSLEARLAKFCLSFQKAECNQDIFNKTLTFEHLILCTKDKQLLGQPK